MTILITNETSAYTLLSKGILGSYFGIGLLPFLTQAQNLNFPVRDRIPQSFPPLRDTGTAFVRVTAPSAHVVVSLQLPYEVAAVLLPILRINKWEDRS